MTQAIWKSSIISRPGIARGRVLPAADYSFLYENLLANLLLTRSSAGNVATKTATIPIGNSGTELGVVVSVVVVWHFEFLS